MFFTYGVYIPLTIIPKGSINRESSEYYNGVMQSRTTCTGKYKNTLIYGIGTFAGLSRVC